MAVWAVPEVVLKNFEPLADCETKEPNNAARACE